MTIDFSCLNNLIAEPNPSGFPGLGLSSTSSPGTKRKIDSLEDERVPQIKKRIISIIQDQVPGMDRSSLESWKPKALIDYISLSPAVPEATLEAIKFLSQQLTDMDTIDLTESSAIPLTKAETRVLWAKEQAPSPFSVSRDSTLVNTTFGSSQSTFSPFVQTLDFTDPNRPANKEKIKDLVLKPLPELEIRIRKENLKIEKLQQILLILTAETPSPLPRNRIPSSHAYKKEAIACIDKVYNLQTIVKNLEEKIATLKQEPGPLSEQNNETELLSEQRDLIQAEKDRASAQNDLALKIHDVKKEIENAQVVQSDLKDQQAVRVALAKWFMKKSGSSGQDHPAF